MTPRLTLNLGLRYDYEQPPVERFNRQNRGFAIDQPNPLAAAVRNASTTEYSAVSSTASSAPTVPAARLAFRVTPI